MRVAIITANTDIYRGNEENVSGEAIKEIVEEVGCEVIFMWKSSVVEIEGGNDDRLRSITVETDGVRSRMEVDRVILAVGSAPASRIVSTTDGIDVDPKGYVLTRETPYGMTTRRGVFAGGDVTNRPATVVHAMQDAKKVAEEIIKYVDAKRLMESLDADDARRADAQGGFPRIF